MFVHKLVARLALITAPLMAIFVFFFVGRNAPGLAPLNVIAAAAAIYATLFAVSCLNLSRVCREVLSAGASGVAPLHLRLILLLVAALVLYIFLDSTLLDYYQPVSLFDDVILALGVVWALSIGILLALALSSAWPREVGGAALVFSAVLLAGWPLAASLPLVNSPQVGEQVSLHKNVFVGGEDGYDVYRIPALLVLPAGSQLANGEVLHKDRLLAMAEARRDGALDTGVIDLVQKVSDDGGASWQTQQLICRHEQEGQRGKCGNATPVFDGITGKVILAYNLSGISAKGNTGEKKRSHSAVVTVSNDGGITWEKPVTIAEAAQNLVFGPGHGIQKRMPPHVGRLLIPGYAGAHAEVLFSDDHGESWQRSNPVNTGNETEVAELSDGRVYMTTRHRAPIGRPPKPNGRLYSISADGGQTWPDVERDTRLPTPVCQASVASYGREGGLLFANPGHSNARVNMAIRYSPDDGTNWARDIPVYSGPAGYSVLGVQSNGSVALLYEGGVMSYSERISFARVEAGAFR
jgi:sialidase-1